MPDRRSQGILVQVYEIAEPAEAERVLAAGVDRIGSVLLSDTEWRVPALREVNRVARGAGAEHSLIPLFGGEDLLCRVIEYYHPHVLHFCESLTSAGSASVAALIELQRGLKRRYPDLLIMRTIPVGRPHASSSVPSRRLASCFAESSDNLLIDTAVETDPVEGFVGITGLECDWEAAGDVAAGSPVPVILAGGLSPDNVYEAIARVRPSGVDSCTRTNAVDAHGRPMRFRKDLAKVRAFVSETRRAERDLLTSEPR